MQFADDVRHQLHGAALAAADVDVAGHIFADGAEFGLGFLHHRQNLFGAFAQQHPFRRQRDVMGLAVQQFLPELLLQIHQLA